MPAITLNVPPRIERQFKAAAKKAWPKETWAFLIGTVAGDHVHVDELYFPDDVDQFATTSSVDVQDSWVQEAAEEAAEMEASVVGSAHSHPYTRNDASMLQDRVQSETDLNSPASRMVVGICVVQEMANQKLRTSLRWHGPTIPVVVQRES